MQNAAKWIYIPFNNINQWNILCIKKEMCHASGLYGSTVLKQVPTSLLSIFVEAMIGVWTNALWLCKVPAVMTSDIKTGIVFIALRNGTFFLVDCIILCDD